MKKYFIECGNQKHDVEITKSKKEKNDIFFTKNGKEAINLLISHLGLCHKDEVLIVSTFNTKYVSKCVTCSIFNKAKPSKVLTNRTKLIYIIHDHGFPLKDFNRYVDISKKNKIPLVEDCAHSITSRYHKEKNRNIGSIGDYTIYSFRKIFPIELGGLGFAKKTEFLNFKKSHKYIQNLDIRYHLKNSLIYHEKRVNNYHKLFDLTKDCNRFSKIIDQQVSPYCFSITHERPNLFRDNFIQLSKDSFECVTWSNLSLVSFPCHQLIPIRKIKQLGLLINKTFNLLNK
tara:strand:+ start:19099 stop:19959 length:861 start_codon:yes stop_codon:yes gene_type:complete